MDKRIVYSDRFQEEVLVTNGRFLLDFYSSEQNNDEDVDGPDDQGVPHRYNAQLSCYEQVVTISKND